MLYRLLSFIFICATWFAQESSAQSPLDSAEYNGCEFYSPFQIKTSDYLRYTNEQELDIFGSADMQLTWGRNIINPKAKSAILQIELSSPLQIDTSQIPLNVSIVVDRSGSMIDFRRMEKVKTAIKEFLKMLRPNDFASIIIYENNAAILLPAQNIEHENLPYIFNLIDSIKPAGGTNMFSGMILGYKEVQKNYNPQAANRVILLTDGIANLGITDPYSIIAQSKTYNSQGIDISTIGVGMDINFTLLHNIAKEGRGLSHFIGDCDSVQNDVARVFHEEFNDMLSLIKNPTLEISYSRHLSATSLSDNEFQTGKRSITIPLKSLPQGSSQLCLIQFTAGGNRIPRKNEITVSLKYTNLLNKQITTKEKSTALLYSSKNNPDADMLENEKVKTNYYIATMANALQKSIADFEKKRYPTAYRTLTISLIEVENKYGQQVNKYGSRQNHVYQLLKYQQRLINGILYNK